MELSFQGQLFNGRPSKAIQQALEDTMGFVEPRVLMRTPVRTGKLKASWSMKPQGNGIRYENPTPYAGFVELGTRKMAPRHMLTKTLPEARVFFEKALDMRLSEELQGKGAVANFLAGFRYAATKDFKSVKPSYLNARRR